MTKKFKTDADFQRLRKQIAFDRMLARVFYNPDAHWYLKGGYSMEIRADRARATKDIDLAYIVDKNELEIVDELLRQELQEALSKNLDDHFKFIVSEVKMDLKGPRLGGIRVNVDAIVNGKLFDRFIVDIGAGDAYLPPLEKVELENHLAFAGIEAPTVEMISLEQQFAEKIHAYTLPRERNSRVKDLIDLHILLNDKKLDMERLKNAINVTFRNRSTHEVPIRLIPPPEEWAKPFQALAEEVGISKDIKSVFEELGKFYENRIIIKTK